jgi:phospholipid-binding lipoprotein MlaA
MVFFWRDNPSLLAKLGAITLLSLGLSACASTHAPTSANDPLESMNRATFAFNREVDKYLLKPIATGYKAITPWPVRTGVGNFFSNMGEVPTTINDLLQGYLKHGCTDFTRFTINSTIGLLGLIDVASYMGLDHHYNDFGITLGKWGITTTPYIVIPLFGPSTIRDSLATLVNYEYFTLWPYIESVDTRNELFILGVVNMRASLFESEAVIKQAALDPYVFTRDAYLQKRRGFIEGEHSFSTAEGHLGADPLDFEEMNHTEPNHKPRLD